MNPSRPPLRLLLVDDHPLVRDGLRLRLEAVPTLQVVGEAGSTEEALSWLAATEQHDEEALPDLALVDINLRGADGLELAARMNEHWPSVAVIILSMHDNTEYVVRAVKAGARGYMLKDEPARDIITAIEAVAAGRNYFSAAIAMRLAQSYEPAMLLTPREREILRHIAEGSANKTIALALNLSVRTVETHRLNIKRKLGIEGQAALIKFAVEHRGL